jgi:hypothetical protein
MYLWFTLILIHKEDVWRIRSRVKDENYEMQLLNVMNPGCL